MKENLRSIIFIVLVSVLAIYIALPATNKLSLKKFRLDWEKPIKLNLGLDLQGGTQIVYEADLTGVEAKNYDEAMSGLKKVIESRVNNLGVSEATVVLSSVGDSHRVIVELPGIKDVNEAIKIIGQTAQLRFLEQNDKKGFVATKLTGKYLKIARVQINPNTSNFEVGLEFNSEGAKIFADLTRRNLQKPLAISLDNRIISAPIVQSVIEDGKAVITGQFDQKTATNLVVQLNAGALPVPVKIVQQLNVGATLGQDSLQKTLLAGIIGFLLVVFFMIIYYKIPGFLASVALSLYIVFLVAIFKYLSITLTLAGIAGFILSIGMAVDANVLIFERFKEEIRGGKPFGLSVEEGFRRAWNSIRDSNVTTLLSALILFWFGSGPIKGFAITLSIGILVSMFTAITVTHAFFRFFVRTRLSKYNKLFV